MMLAGPSLKVVPLTVHIPLAEVPRRLDQARHRPPGADRGRGAAARFRHRPAAAGGGRAQPACRRGRARWATRRPGSSPRRSPTCGRTGIDVARPAGGRHHVPQRRPRRLRCGPVHVPRPGADPGEDARFRRGRERDPRAAVRAHLARPWHGAGHRRPGRGAARQPDRGARARRRHGRTAAGRPGARHDDAPHPCGWASTSTMWPPCATRAAGRIPTRSGSRSWRSRPGWTASPCTCARTGATSATATSSG